MRASNQEMLMKTLLQLNTSLFSDNGQSSRLASEFVAGWRSRKPGAAVFNRELARDPVPHLSAERFQSFLTPAPERSPEQQAVVGYSDTLIDELRRADVIVIGLPMYNFGVPSTLKAYFDHIARAGVTFRYTEKGPQGLLTGKKAYVFAARGGRYAGTAGDSETAFVRQLLGFLGIDEVEFVYAEGLAIDEASKKAALAGAERAIARLVTPEALAA
jgi:FMN-dependent NADH-azoreductase